MFRNFFNEPKPGSHAELIEACNEVGLNPATCVIVLEDYSGQNDEPYDGWCAEISGNLEDGGIATIDTIAWDSEQEARNDLEAAGFNL